MLCILHLTASGKAGAEPQTELGCIPSLLAFLKFWISQGLEGLTCLWLEGKLCQGLALCSYLKLINFHYPLRKSLVNLGTIS